MRPYIFLTLLYGVSMADPSLRYTSYHTTPVCQPATAFATPKNIFDLQVLLIEAKLKRSTLKAVGSRHSATDIICTDGTPVIMEAFNTTRMNSDGTATLGAGLTLGEALEFLEQNGKAFPIVPQYQGITIGGAIGTGAHGSSLKHPTALSDQLVKLKVLDGNGLVREISGNELNIFRVNIGLLGFVLEATFRVVPSFKFTIESKNYPDSILDDDTIVQWARDYDYFVAQWWPNSNEVTVTTGVKQPLSTPGNAFQNLYNPSPSRVTAFTKQLTDFIAERRNLPAALALERYSEEVFYNFVVDRLPYFTEDNIKWLNPATGLGWKLTSDGCDEAENGCSWKNGNNSLYFDEEEIAVPLTEFTSAIRTFKGIFQAKMAPFTFTGLVMRFQKASDATLYMAQGRDVCAFEFIYPQRVDSVNDPPLNVATYQALVQAMVLKHGGRPHWGKNGLAWSNPSIIRSQYPKYNREKFIAAMILNDPWGVFRNKFAYRLLGLSDKTDADPAEIHCALRQNCICSKDSDCANNEKNAQICGDILDVDGKIKYKVCQDTKTYVNPQLLPFNRQNFTSIALSIYGSYAV